MQKLLTFFFQQKCLYQQTGSSYLIGPASVVQLDARPTGSGLNLARSAKFFCGDLIVKFLVFLSLWLIQEGQLSVSGKRIHNTG